ncbi:MAG: 4-(cytidine 5'-diphospho)-2-C-methyl-D-erythritol kinase [Pseudomonadota bacterium]|jgi:4-diphosphocytidyl-2-C-methyl-D-erythritol kinase
MAAMPPDRGEARIWPAPAKLNLFLHVTGRRPDGYHTLQTVFQFLDIADGIGLRVEPGGGVQLATPLPGVPAERDLTVRAARLLQAEAGTGLGATITVDKRLPLGGGLGGGSSDAATVLVVLNRLWDIGFSIDRLAELGLRLGADVPVFVRGQAAWAEGVGERLTPVTLPEPWYLVVVPDVTVSTAEIFSAPELTRQTPPITIADFLSGAGGNDCEPVVRRRHPEVGRALDWLNRFAPARLTGTGACVFAPFADRDIAQQALAQLPAGWRALIARGRNRSPLHEALESRG